MHDHGHQKKVLNFHLVVFRLLTCSEAVSVERAIKSVRAHVKESWTEWCTHFLKPMTHAVPSAKHSKIISGRYIYIIHNTYKYPPTPAACWGSAPEKYMVYIIHAES